MKINSNISLLGLLLTFPSMVLLSCNDNNTIEKQCQSDVKSVEDVKNKAEGLWSLVTIKSGWTGETKSLDDKLIIKIDNKQKVIIYDDNKALGNMQFMFTRNQDRFIYTTSSLIGSSGILVLTDGLLTVCDERLILDNTSTDGGLYTFNRVKATTE